MTSRPLPSSSRMSTTANAGAFCRIRSMPSATEWAAAHLKTARLHGPRQPQHECTVVVDQDERAIFRQLIRLNAKSLRHFGTSNLPQYSRRIGYAQAQRAFINECCDPLRACRSAALGVTVGSHSLLLENITGPADITWPMFRPLAVIERKRGPERSSRVLAMKKPAPGLMVRHPLSDRATRRAGGEWLTQGIHDVRGYSGAVVGDLDCHVPSGPPGADFDVVGSRWCS